jgi:hypothetical protein
MYLHDTKAIRNRTVYGVEHLPDFGKVAIVSRKGVRAREYRGICHACQALSAA